MAWSWRLGTVAGIPVYVHWSFLILPAWVLVEQLDRGRGLAPALAAVGLVLTLFGCVVLHELGHALTARRFGIPTLDITLLPIGGIARMPRLPEQPLQEMLVAAAGPAVNLAIALALAAAGVRVGGAGVATGPDAPDPGFFPQLLLLNAWLAAFNLLPAFPMDGGRVLRAVLAMRGDYARATRAAATVGQLLAIGFVMLGLRAGNPVLIVLALFVWIGAEAEASQVEQREVLRGVPVRAAMLTEFHTLHPADTLGHAAEVLLAGSQHDFPVLDGDNPVGLLTRAGLLAGLARAGRDATVGDFASAGCDCVDAGSPLAAALARLRETGSAGLTVVEGGRTVGLLTPDHVAEYVMVRAALADAPPARAAAAAGP